MALDDQDIIQFLFHPLFDGGILLDDDHIVAFLH